ncbi:MAG: carbohydrate ABC transporter permease [Labedaea sp.]
MRSTAPTTVRTADADTPAPAATRHPASRWQPRSRPRSWLVAWLFLAPALIIFVLFKFVPMVRAVNMSFLEVRPYLGDRWVGWANYRQVLTDPAFTNAIRNTVVLALGQTIGSVTVGLALALLVEGSARHLWFIRTAVFLPVVTAIAVVAELWRILYYPAPDGTINDLLGWVGLGPSQFLNSEHTSMASVIAVGIWRQAPYDMMIILAGLAGVDRDLYEASAVDGAGVRARLWHVTFPALRPVFVILFTLAAIRNLRIFVEIYLLTNGGPNGSTDVMITLVFRLGLERNEYGVAAAGTVVLLIATMALTLAVRLARWRR